MRNLLKIMMVAVVACNALAAPVHADDDDDRRWHKRNHSYWHDKHHYKHYKHKHNSRVVIINPGRPYYNNVYIHRYPRPVYYSSPAYREIRCTNSYNPLGLLLGGAAGGIVGNQFGKGHGRTASVISGAVIGSAIGAGASSQHCSEEVFEQAPVGMPVSWQSASAQEFYSVIPTRDFNTEGRYCREYQARATVGGRTQQTYGTACMQPDGSWEVVN